MPVTPFALVDRIGIPQQDGLGKLLILKGKRVINLSDKAINIVPFWSSAFLALFGGSSLLASRESSLPPRRKLKFFSHEFLNLTFLICEQLVPVGIYASSRQTPFLCALIIGFTAIILYATGTSIAMLAVGRCIQGISVSILFSVGLAHLVDIVGRDEVGQWIGFVLSGMNTGVMLSRFLGGLVYNRAGYIPVFLMCLGIIVVVFFLRVSIVDRKIAEKYLKVLSTVDEAGQTPSEEQQVGSHTLPSSVVSSDDGKTSPKKTNATKPIRVEASERDPLISKIHNNDRNQRNEPQNAMSVFSRRLLVTKTLFKSTRILTACFGIFIHITVITAFDAVLPIYVNEIFGWRSTGAGLIFLAITLPAILGAAVGDASDRFGPRTVALSGFAIAVPSIALLGLVKHDSVVLIILLCAILAFTGQHSAFSNVSKCNRVKSFGI